jgi:F-box/WD-40 domain protein MET30
VYAQIPSKLRNLALDGLLHYSCFPQLSYLSNMLDSLTKVDFLEMLPNEVSFKILNYLDATALCRSSQTSKKWKELCDNDVIWKRMFQQHVDKVCTKCGWGLPSMISSVKRKESVHAQQPFKKQKTSTSSCITFQPLDSLPLEQETPKPILSRPWKSIYAERCVVAKNWKKSRFSSKNLIGHTDAVMEMYFDEARSLLISASMDGTLRAWNTDSGLCVGILKGHTAGVRSVQFDDSKIVSCSIDKTIRIWSRKTFECVRVIEGKGYVYNRTFCRIGIYSFY